MRIEQDLKSTRELILAVNKSLYNTKRSNRCVITGYAASQWLSTWLQMLGVAMVTGVAFIAVLEHHLNSVNPGAQEFLVASSIYASSCARVGGAGHLLCSVSHQPIVRGRHIVHRDRETDGQC